MPKPEYTNAEMRHKHVHHITLTAIIAVALLISLANPPLVAAQAPEIVAKRIEGTVTVDGLATESVWAKAPAVTIPLSASTDEGGHVSSITVKAVNNGEWLYLLIQWEDPTASLLQNVTAESHPVEEEEEEEEEEMAAEQEDRLAVMWYIRGNLMAYPCMKMGTNGAVTQGEVDLWHWHGARDNPDSPHYGHDGKYNPPHPFAVDQYSDTEARSSDKGDSFWDVYARARWSDGVWTMELGRAFQTGDTAQDVQFQLGESYPVAFAVFEGGSGETEESKSISSWYTLEISDQWLEIPASQQVSALEAEVTDLKSALADVEGQLEGLRTRLSGLESSLTDIGSRIESVDAKVAELAQLGSAISDVKSAVDSLKGVVQDLKGTVDAVQNTAADATELASSAAGQVNLSLSLAVLALIVAIVSIALSRRR